MYFFSYFPFFINSHLWLNCRLRIKQLWNLTYQKSYYRRFSVLPIFFLKLSFKWLRKTVLLQSKMHIALLKSCLDCHLWIINKHLIGLWRTKQNLSHKSNTFVCQRNFSSFSLFGFCQRTSSLSRILYVYSFVKKGSLKKKYGYSCYSFFSFLNNAFALRTEFPKRFSTSEVTILAQTRSTWSGGTWTNHFPDVISMLEEKTESWKESHT